MSEYRTHLRESVEALRDAAQRVAEALDETAGSGAGVSSAVPDPTGSSVGELSDAAPSPAPSSPPDARRWWLVKFEGWTTFLCTTEAEERRMFPGRARTVIPVVPAAALDAMREERDQAIHEQHVANDHLASLRRVIAKRGPEMQALDEAIRDRGCYDPALTVAQNALTYINQLGEWLDQRTNSANALLEERNAACAEVRLKEETITELRAERDAAIRERDEARADREMWYTVAETRKDDLAAEYEVRRHVLHALSGQGLPRVLPFKGHGVITDAHALYERMVAAESALREARRLTPEVFEQACKAFRCAGITRQSVADSLRAALLAAGCQEDTDATT